MPKKNHSWPGTDDEQPDALEPEKSKSELKREMLALQKIGEDIANLPNAQFIQIPLEETLREALELFRRLKNREGRRRQMQYIGKLMRVADTDLILAKLDLFRKDGETYRRHFHRIEKWRDKIIENGDDAVNQLLSEEPQLDRQHLRQMVRQSQKELSQNKPPAASRKLFQYLRDTIEPH
ncbi:MAG: ribosome biogenesis factor YjgA [Porticoccaceae bacterium]|nr:DUF615 domain-containing protein [Pseudomonadales bacterium]MCP5172608.1 DUF615 domain-containing protein [Pseudomonadales bacterium]MCP5303524.1 DUF615 domain-containing protein [Pseudomonadales bacterium]